MKKLKHTPSEADKDIFIKEYEEHLEKVRKLKIPMLWYIRFLGATLATYAASANMTEWEFAEYAWELQDLHRSELEEQGKLETDEEWLLRNSN